MVGCETPLCKKSRGLVIALLVLTILSWPWSIWFSVYGFYDASEFRYYLYSYSSYDRRYRILGGMGIASGISNIVLGLFCLVKVTMFSMDLDRKLSFKVRKRWIKAYLTIEPILFILILSFSIAYIIQYRRTSLESGYILWTLMGLTLGFQGITYPLALMLYHVEKSRVQRDSDHETDQTTLVGHEMKNVTSSS